MPYIEEKHREKIDSCINELVICLKTTLITAQNVNVFSLDKVSNQDMLEVCGNLNYTITRICANLMGETSYSKIALITGVLENVKQEFYRRVASSYEDKKILQNGDVKEYKKL